MFSKFNLKEYKQIPNRNNHNCFACSAKNETGLQMEFFTDEESVFSKIIIPIHLCGWENLAHGGITSTILDEIMGWAAIHLHKSIILTKSIAVDFLKPIKVGDFLFAIGSTLEKKRDREVIMKGEIYNEENVLCAKSSGNFALFTPDEIRKKEILDEQSIDDIVALM